MIHNMNYSLSNDFHIRIHRLSIGAYNYISNNSDQELYNYALDIYKEEILFASKDVYMTLGTKCGNTTKLTN